MEWASVKLISNHSFNMIMIKFDAIIIGAGSGLQISSYAGNKGLKVAIIEKA